MRANDALSKKNLRLKKKGLPTNPAHAQPPLPLANINKMQS